MKRLFFVLLSFFVSIAAYGQHHLRAVLWDKQAKAPVVYATVVSGQAYAISNEEGGFEISFSEEALHIDCLGYESLSSSFTALAGRDTLYLSPKTFVLEEVTIDPNESYRQMVKAIDKWYALDTHKERFFIRCLLRKNGQIEKLIDIVGKVEKKALMGTPTKPFPKKPYKVEIEQLRVAAINSSKVYKVNMPELADAFMGLAVMGTPVDHFWHRKLKGEGSAEDKIEFGNKDTQQVKTSGYYLMDNERWVPKQFAMSADNIAIDYKKNFWGLKHRVLHRERRSDFALNPATGKYQLARGTLLNKQEVLSKEGTDIFELYYFYDAQPLPMSEPLKENASVEKDMFKLKFPYNAAYWEHNNVLLLTDEMQAFVKRVGSEKEFKTVTNLRSSE